MLQKDIYYSCVAAGCDFKTARMELIMRSFSSECQLPVHPALNALKSTLHFIKLCYGLLPASLIYQLFVDLTSVLGDFFIIFSIIVTIQQFSLSFRGGVTYVRNDKQCNTFHTCSFGEHVHGLQLIQNKT